MPDDKRDGDDLFEDLDKFFAPIKDVDWDEPADPGVSASPSEEHVSVQNAPTRPGTSAEPAENPPSPMDQSPSGDDDEPDAAWYDTSVMAPIDDLLGEGEGDLRSEAGTSEQDAMKPSAGQADLFGASADEGGTDQSSRSDHEAAVHVSRETQPMPAFLDEPSDADVQHAVEHLAVRLSRMPHLRRSSPSKTERTTTR